MLPSLNIPIALLGGLAILVLCWPLAQAWRHSEMRPVAAWLIFASVLALAGAVSFQVLLGLVLLILPAAVAGHWLTGGVVGLMALALAVLAARRVVRRPPWREMPR